jgi:thermitase
MNKIRKRNFKVDKTQVIIKIPKEFDFSTFIEVIKEFPELGYIRESSNEVFFLSYPIGSGIKVEKVTIKNLIKRYKLESEKQYKIIYKYAKIDKNGITRYFIPNEICVKFKNNLKETEIKNIFYKLNINDYRSTVLNNYYEVIVSSNLFKSINIFNKIEEVEYAEPSEFRTDGSPCGLLLKSNKNLRNNCNWIDYISLKEAWSIESGNKDVVIVIIDYGFNIEHENIKSNLIKDYSSEWNFSSNEVNDDPKHGTNVAGIAAGADANEFKGVAYDCSLLPLTFETEFVKMINIVRVFDFVINEAKKNSHKRYIINCSWSLYIDHLGLSKTIEEAKKQNILIVCSSGNCNEDGKKLKTFPSYYDSTMSVAALNCNDKKYLSSNYGKHISVSASGYVDKTSSAPGDNQLYSNFEKTSAAAPQVAGLAGLIWSKNMKLKNKEVQKYIENSCDNVDHKNKKKHKLGKGKINALRALNDVVNDMKNEDKL